MPDYKTVHDADTTAGSDTTAEVYIGGVKTNTAGVSTNVGLRKEQLSDQIATAGRVKDMDLEIAGLKTETPVPDDPVTRTVAASISANRLTVSIAISGYTGVGGAVTVNSAAVPTATTWTGAAPTSYQTPTADFGVSEILRFWEVDSVGVWTEFLTATGESGISVSYVATDPPLHVSTFAVQSVTATTATVTVVATTAVDDATGSNLQYDVIDAGIGITLAADVTPGTVLVEDLIPDTTYQFAQKTFVLSDNSREDISNIVSQDTSSVGTISFSFTTETDTLDVPYATFVVTDAAGTTIDEVHLNTTGEAPTSSSTFIAVPTLPDTYTVPGYGDTPVYGWGRDATFPTSITPVATATASTTRTSSAAATFSISEISAEISEENQPIYTLTILRGDSLTGDATISLITADGTDGEGAISNTHFVPQNTTVTCLSDEAATDVEIQILTTNLGHNNGTPIRRWFTATISSPSTGDVVSGQDEATISIYGCYKTIAGQKIGGYYANGQIDLNALPVDLDKATSSLTVYSGTNPETISLINHDSNQDSSYSIELPSGTQKKTFKDCIFQNAFRSCVNILGPVSDITFKHCAFQDWNKAVTTSPSMDNLVFRLVRQQDSPYTNDFSVLGCRAEGPGRFFVIQYGRGKRHYLLWNYFKNTGNSYEAAVDKALIDDGHFGQWADNNLGGQHILRGNVVLWPRTAIAGGAGFDCINFFFRLPYQEADRNYVERNMLLLSTDITNEGSATALIMGDQMTDLTRGFITTRYNTISNSANIGISARGSNLNIRDNDVYSPDIPAYAHVNGTGLAANPGVSLLSSTFADNNVFWHQYRSDSLTVAAHTYGGLPSSAQNIITDWATGGSLTAGGELTVKQRHPVINNPAWDDGIDIAFSHNNCPAGNGRLFWDASENQLSFAAEGEAYGTPVDISLTASGDAGDWDAWYDIPSADTDGIRVVINPTDLTTADTPGTDIYWSVKCTGMLFDDYMPDPYDADTGEYGEWGGKERDTQSGTDRGIPDNVDATSASATSIDVTWDAVSGANSYRVYRSLTTGTGFSLISSPTTNSYTDTGLTEGTRYYYKVASADQDVISDTSLEVSAVPVSTSAIITDGEFQTDATDIEFGSTKYTDWGRKGTDMTVTVSGGVLTMTNAEKDFSGYIYFSKTGLSLTGTSYEVQGSVSQGRSLIDFDTVLDNPGGSWKDGDVLNNVSIDTTNSPFTQATTDPATWNSTSQMFVVLWCGPLTTIKYDYIRLIDTT